MISSGEEASGYQREHLLEIEEITHPGAHRVFESVVQQFEVLNKELETVTEGQDFDEEAYAEARNRVLDQGSILLPENLGPITASGKAIEAPRDRPLFGLHNRDYPSLWGLMLLADAATDGPVPWSEWASGLQLAADAYGGCLVRMDEVERPKRGLKYSSSFPDPDKKAKGGQWIHGVNGRKTARLYQFVKNTFARVQKSGGNVESEARGALPRWDAVRFLSDDGDLLVEPTRTGYELLDAMEGVSLRLPHRSESALSFMRYLMVNSPGDADGFRQVMTAIETKGDREEVVLANLSYFNSFLGRDDENEAVTFASTMTQGYVARAREWGLLETDLAVSSEDGRKIYRLTETGIETTGLLGR